MFFHKLHECEGKTICSVCDSEILGKVFEENERVLDVDESFFGGEKSGLKDIKKIANHIRESHTSNIIGNRIVAELVKEGALKAGSVKEISGIKYAMVFKI